MPQKNNKHFRLRFFRTFRLFIGAAGFLLSLFTDLMAQGGVMPLEINFSASDSALYGPSQFSRKSFRLNSRTDSTALGYMAVVCDTFPDLISGNFYAKSFFEAVRLDSVRFRISHVNHSGQPDTLIFGITGTYAGVFPQEAGSFSDTLITTQSLSGTDSAAWVSFPAGDYVSPSFSVFLRYRGAAQDTFLIWSGFGYDGECMEIPGTKRALNSHFYPNSFALRKDIGQILPTLAGFDVFFNCDTLPGFDEETDGRSYIQNWDVHFFLTTVTTGIQDNDSGIGTLVYPNPGLGVFHINRTAQRVRLVSITGVTVWEETGYFDSFAPDVAPGIYWAEISTQGKKELIKLIITRP
jgi:hypothetical protein